MLTTGCDTIPTLAEMRRRMHDRITAIGTDAEIRLLGKSAQDRPIELVSIGKGERSALIVGAPHPNEPIGCMTIASLVKRLATDHEFRNNSGFRWHFIQAIDADGVALNEGWFGRERTLENYLAGFFRPAFALQPEYSFPINLSGYRFDAATPENLCWQRALEMTRPNLQCSLHGADIGGVFYVMSENRPGLSAVLREQPGLYRLTLNTTGEPFSDMEQFAPGVFGFPPITAMIKSAIAKSGGRSTPWHAGRSSAEYSAEKYGTFSMTCEVPLWDESRLHSDAMSSMTLVDILRRQSNENDETATLLGAWLPALRPLANTNDQKALLAALEETLVGTQHQKEQLAALQALQPVRTKPLSVSVHACAENALALAGMRAPAMLVRLAKLVHVSAARRSAGEILKRRMIEFRGSATIAPVPFAVMVQVQLASILSAASSMRAST